MARIRAVLEEQSRQEAETGKRAELLLAELERQQQEEEREDTDLHRQVIIKPYTYKIAVNSKVY